MKLNAKMIDFEVKWSIIRNVSGNKVLGGIKYYVRNKNGYKIERIFTTL